MMNAALALLRSIEQFVDISNSTVSESSLSTSSLSASATIGAQLRAPQTSTVQIADNTRQSSEWSDFDGDAILVDVALRCGMMYPTLRDAARLNEPTRRVVQEFDAASASARGRRYTMEELNALDAMRLIKRSRSLLLLASDATRHRLAVDGAARSSAVRGAMVHVDYFDLAAPMSQHHVSLANSSAHTMRAFEALVAPRAATFVERYACSLLMNTIDLRNFELDLLAPLCGVVAPHRLLLLPPALRTEPVHGLQAQLLAHNNALTELLMPSESDLFNVRLPFLGDDDLPAAAAAVEQCRHGDYCTERVRMTRLSPLCASLDLLRRSASDARLHAVINALPLGDVDDSEKRVRAVALVEKQIAAIEGASGFGDAARTAALDQALAGDSIEGVTRRVGLFRMSHCPEAPPRTVTVFFGGTSSHAGHAFHSHTFPRGELLASLAAVFPGTRDVDFLYVDGVAGVGVGFDHRDRLCQHGQSAVAIGSGTGIVESAVHALCWLKGVSMFDKHTEQMERHYGAYGAIERVNVVGWSRGGVAAIVLSHLIASDPMLSNAVEVNVCAIDPVPGGNQLTRALGVHDLTDRRFFTLPVGLRQFFGLYALSERSDMFSPTVPEPLGQSTRYNIDGIAGLHSTLVGGVSEHSAQDAHINFSAIAFVVAARVVSFLAGNGVPQLSGSVRDLSRLSAMYEWLHKHESDYLHLTSVAIVPDASTLLRGLPVQLGGVMQERAWWTFDRLRDAIVLHDRLQHDFATHLLSGVDRNRFVCKHHQELQRNR
jgi:hypothetical protein